ncbi:hypothetical protein D3C72_1975670 [compost metagenome]
MQLSDPPMSVEWSTSGNEGQAAVVAEDYVGVTYGDSRGYEEELRWIVILSI